MWDERYQTTEYIFGDQPCEWLIMNQHRLPKSGKALALGDGEGRNGVFLAELGLKVTSVDLSEVGLIKARDLAVKRGVAIQTVQADLEDYEIDPESDVERSVFREAMQVTHTPAEAGQCRSFWTIYLVTHIIMIRSDILAVLLFFA